MILAPETKTFKCKDCGNAVTYNLFDRSAECNKCGLRHRRKSVASKVWGVSLV